VREENFSISKIFFAFFFLDLPAFLGPVGIGTPLIIGWIGVEVMLRGAVGGVMLRGPVGGVTGGGGVAARVGWGVVLKPESQRLLVRFWRCSSSTSMMLLAS